MPRTDDQVALPITEAQTINGNGGSLFDRHLVRDSAAPFATAIPFPAGLLAAQSSMQGATTPLVGIDALVDGLMAGIGSAVIGTATVNPNPFWVLPSWHAGAQWLKVTAAPPQ